MFSKRSALLAMVVSATTMVASAQGPAGSHGVQIVRDKWGVAHVYADTVPALYYGAAYSAAQDRLAEGEGAIRLAVGRLSEIYGASKLDSDREARVRMMTEAEAKRQFEALDHKHQAMFTAMYEGWMARVREVRKNPDLLPYEFKEWGIQPTEWTLWDFVNAMNAPFERFAQTGREDGNLAYLQALVKKYGAHEARVMFEDTYPLYDPDTIPTVDIAEDKVARPEKATLFEIQAALPAKQYAAVTYPRYPTASRAFIIGKSRTAHGYPILFESTADGPTVHLSGAGINVAGWFWVPFGPMLMGRSENHAFLITAEESNISDVFVEKVNPRNPRQYFYKGQWRDMEVRPQTVLVKDGRPVHFEAEYTVHGPVVDRPAGQDDVAYTVRNSITGYQLAGLAAMMDSNQANSFEAYRTASYHYEYDYNQFYIGEDGTIAYIAAGNTPIRAKGLDLRLPTPGTGEYEWQGFLPPDQKPQVVNPKRDYFFNWNSAPSANWPSMSLWGRTFRAWWGAKLFKEQPSGITPAQAQVWHRRVGTGSIDPVDPKYFTPYLRRVIGNDIALKAAVDAMESWNSSYEDMDHDGYYDNVGITLFRKWDEIATQQIVDANFDGLGNKPEGWGLRRSLLLRVLQSKDAGVPMQHDWFNGQNRDQVIRKTLMDTVAALTQQYGSSDQKTWKMRVFYRYYDCSEVAKNPDKPLMGDEPCIGGNKGGSSFTLQTAARLGLQPKFIPDNLAEEWSTLMEVSPKDKALHDSTPTGGQNLFINTQSKGNPNISDQVELHHAFTTKTVELERRAVMKGMVSTLKINYSPAHE